MLLESTAVVDIQHQISCETPCVSIIVIQRLKLPGAPRLVTHDQLSCYSDSAMHAVQN